jgi:hypothetical protein
MQFRSLTTMLMLLALTIFAVTPLCSPSPRGIASSATSAPFSMTG